MQYIKKITVILKSVLSLQMIQYYSTGKEICQEVKLNHQEQLIAGVKSDHFAVSLWLKYNSVNL